MFVCGEVRRGRGGVGADESVAVDEFCSACVQKFIYKCSYMAKPVLFWW